MAQKLFIEYLLIINAASGRKQIKTDYFAECHILGARWQTLKSVWLTRQAESRDRSLYYNYKK